MWEEIEKLQAQVNGLVPRLRTAAELLDSMPVGGICIWSGTLALIPANYHLCDGTAGTPDYRGRFLLGAAAAVEAGTAGGAVQHTPVGVVAAPVFTGAPSTASSTAADPDLVTADILATGVAPITTPLGTNSAPAFTGTAASYYPLNREVQFIMRIS